MNALEKLLSKETLAALVDIEGLRDHWRKGVEGSTVAQAYYVMTQNGIITDVKLADLWLNSDALHPQLIESAIGKDMSLNERYKANLTRYCLRGHCDAVSPRTALVLTKHGQRHQRKHHEHHDPRGEQADHHSGHDAVSSLPSQPPQRVEYRSIVTATWSSSAVRCGRCSGGSARGCGGPSTTRCATGRRTM